MSGKKFEGLPDFLVIGAGKSGTTSIDKYLNQHPGIFVPKSKEPNFFGYENKTEGDFAGNPDDLAHFRRSVTTLEAYLAIFADAEPDQIKGETSNTYMYHPQAPERIKYYNPDIRLIAILRQPAARLYSRFMHLARENRPPSPNFSDCLDRNSVWWKRNDLISEGFYYRNLKPYFELFPREQLRIYLYEDLQQAPQKVMQEIYAFLGADATFTPNVSLRYNESGLIKNPFLNRIYGQGGLLSRSIRAILPGTVVQRLRSNLSLKKKILDLRGKNLIKPKMDPELKRTLTTDVYGEDIRQLQNLIGRDLSHWLNV
ncbi:MAG TPA: sulfotransferase [Ohtaekwangia sp.]|nr:sulfotransferase [Ohtaekwangia sp.]